MIIADTALSSNNAVIIGMAVTGLKPELRKKSMIFGNKTFNALPMDFLGWPDSVTKRLNGNVLPRHFR